MTLHTLYRFLLLLALTLQVDSSCYYPDGTYIAHDQRCIDNGTLESFCCGPGAICLSDQICWAPGAPEPFTYVRGSCTDQTFVSSACPHFCLTPSDRAGIMYRCSGIADSYCCSADNNPCSCEISNVTLAPLYKGVSSIGSIPLEAAVTQSASSSTPSIGPTTTSAAITVSPPSNSAVPHTLVVSSVTMTMSISAPLSQTVNSTDSSSTSHSGSKEGAAVGVPVAVLSVIIIFLVAFLIRQQRRAQSKMANTVKDGAYLDAIYPSANNDNSFNIPMEQQRSEVPAGIAATEVEAGTKRSELVA